MGLLLALCLLPAMALAEEDADASPTVMSSFRHETFPAPDVPVCAPVDDAYFTDAVIVGDSTAEPFDLLGVVPELEVLTVIGISPRTATDNSIFTHDGESCTLTEKLVAIEPSAIYLWLGSNGVDTKDAERVLEDYDRLLNVMLAALPDVPVYLMELTPVKLIAQEQYANYTNERVDAFNEGLYEVARRHNVYILQINALFKNERGTLDNEYGAGDGIHLRTPAYDLLADFLYTHAIPMEVEK